MSGEHTEHTEQASSNRTGMDTSMGDRRGDGGAFADAGGQVPRSENPVDPAVLESALGHALRADALDPQAEKHAVAAFRAAREAGVHSDTRTRKRDDWRARRGPLRRGLKAAAALFGTSLALGGVAIAAIGSPDGPRAAPQDRASGPPHPSPTAAQPSSPTPRADRPDRPAEPETSVAAERPPSAKDIQAHCRAYASVKGRGKALDSTAWQRFIATAGGEENVAAYCADLSAKTETDTGEPGKPGKVNGRGNPWSAGEKPEQEGPGAKGPQGPPK